MKFENVQTRKMKSETGNLAVRAERIVEYADWTMQHGLSENSRVTLHKVSDSQYLTYALLNYGFEYSELSNLEYARIPSDLLVMGKSQWVLSKYATQKSSITEVRAYDKANHVSNLIGWSFNGMGHDNGLIFVIGGKLGAKTYIAPYRVVELLEKHNTLDNQLFNGFLLGLNKTEKKALRYNSESNYSKALRQNAYDKVLSEDLGHSQVFYEENTENTWAFRVLDAYHERNKEFETYQQELEVTEFLGEFYDSLESVDWRKSAESISEAVILKIDKSLRDLVNFYNSEAVIEAIEDSEFPKAKFETVQAEIVKLAEKYAEFEAEEDNTMADASTIEDYDSDLKTDYSQSRGYSKAYLEREFVEKAIARAVITDYEHEAFYSDKKLAYELADWEYEVRASSDAHEKARETLFREMAAEQAYWDNIEAKYGVRGLTAFTPASDCPDTECEWASGSDERFGIFLQQIGRKMRAKQKTEAK